MRLWEKAKANGSWNPSEIDFTIDQRDWSGLEECQRSALGALCRLFSSGEQAVTLDLLPLIQLVAAEGRREEEIYLASFLLDEAKHADLFDRFLATVCDNAGSAMQFPAHNKLFHTELRDSLQNLKRCHSVQAQIRASTTYHLVIEGIMAQTGHFCLRRILRKHRILPGMLRALHLVQRDESRHIAFGIYFISRLISSHGNGAYRALLDRMSELKPCIDSARQEFLDLLGDSKLMGLSPEDILRFSSARFMARMQRINRVRMRPRASLALPR